MTLKKLLSILAVLSLAVSSSAAFPEGCKSYTAPSTTSGKSPLLSSILIGDAFYLGQVFLSDLSLESTSPMEALKISLSAVTPSFDIVTVILKSTGEGGSLTSLSNAVFDDSATQSFPDGLESPTSSSYFPYQDFSAFLNTSSPSSDAGEGGSQGHWVLRIVDLSENSSAGSLNLSSWSLILCPADVVIPPPPDVTALSGSSDNSTSLRLLESILNRIDRNLTTNGPLNGTLARDFSSYQSGNTSNASAFQRIENRLNQLLSGYSGEATNTSASLLGSFRLGNDTLPTGPTARLLDALRAIIVDLEESNTSSTGSMLSRSSSSPPAVSSASGSTDTAGSSLLNLKSALTSGSMLKSLVGSLSGLSSSGNYLQQAMQFVQSMESKVSSSPMVSSAKAGLKSIETLASQATQSKINLFTSQSSLIKSQLQSKISNYENAIKLSSSLISQAIEQQSSKAIGAAKALQTKAADLKAAVKSTAASKMIQSRLSSISQSAHAIGSIGKTLAGDMTSLVQQLTQVYKSQIQGVSDIASAKSSAKLSSAQALADASISALIAMVDKTNMALDQWSSGLGPLAGKEIKIYEAGLSFFNTGLQTIKSRIVSSPTSIDYSTLGANKGAAVSALSGGSDLAGNIKQEVQKYFGSGATGAINTRLVAAVDQFNANLKSLFPNLGAPKLSGRM